MTGGVVSAAAVISVPSTPVHAVGEAPSGSSETSTVQLAEGAVTFAVSAVMLKGKVSVGLMLWPPLNVNAPGVTPDVLSHPGPLYPPMVKLSDGLVTLIQTIVEEDVFCNVKLKELVELAGTLLGVTDAVHEETTASAWRTKIWRKRRTIIIAITFLGITIYSTLNQVYLPDP